MNEIQEHQTAQPDVSISNLEENTAINDIKCQFEQHSNGCINQQHEYDLESGLIILDSIPDSDLLFLDELYTETGGHDGIN